VPDGWAVKAIRHNSDNVTDAVLDFASGQVWSDVQIELTSRLTSVVGEVVDRDAPTPDGTVIVFPADREKQFEESRYVQAVRPDQHGRYEIPRSAARRVLDCRVGRCRTKRVVGPVISRRTSPVNAAADARRRRECYANA